MPNTLHVDYELKTHDETVQKLLREKISAAVFSLPSAG